MSEKLYRVCWISKLTGARGHGKALSKRAADDWVAEGNKQYPELEHWAEPLG